MSTKRKILEVVNKIALEKTAKAINQIDAYGKESVILKMTDELVGLYNELARKQNTPITRELLEKNGFIRYEEYDRESCYPFEKYRFGLLEVIAIDDEFMIEGTFIKVKTVANLDDALELCGIDKEIEV